MSFLNAPEPSERRGLLTAVCVVLVLAGGLVAFTLGAGGAMSSDSCRPGDESFLCTSTGQNFAFWFPLGGWIAAIILGALCVTRLDRRRRSRWFGVAVGAAVFLVIVVIDWLVISG
ncbi:hypothetical protein [Amycolatopsis keratiniphila]|uniref:Uncharacterized protein n=1 Tax=Amycolatopsis keratiniphila subsp. keratiniphila TaxID=227715 RepID=A0A1W2LS69_9PSEU|nr:hypothetical protein [Amycolatopsis keratiniphila]OLZ46630.1 hypothetical protein BS330_36275 [Amycolatopsis keratiniphila subsp. nogabecina]ONF67456.1 hypothetical protein AVR91_0222140 [Amycolatopsis keratiniphila subsp. keratiniphila]SDU41259.1 hypothetical protein SAMN04489733_3935 [Amycolatopsis keratiniphila]